MGRWERISEQVAALPDDEREAVMDQVEALLGGGQESDLTDEQCAELERRMREPAVYASEAEVASALAAFRA
jgi:hypothetical protein